jgi:hypothetical protein
MPSKGKASASGASKEGEKYHLDYDCKNPPKRRKVDVPSCSQKNEKAQTLIWDGVMHPTTLISMTS